MGNQKKILVVDDDRDILESISLILETKSYTVIAVESGEECLAILNSENPDLIVLDIMMNTMTDGINVCFKIRSKPGYRSIPIVMISSIEKQTGFAINKEYLHIDEFLEKPFQPSVLLEAVRKLLL